MEPTARDLDLILSQRDLICALARSLVRDPADAEDLAQESLLRALRGRPRFDGNPVRLRAWFGTVLRNLARNRARDGRHRAEREEHVARDEAVEDASLRVQAEVADRLITLVARLPENARSVVLLRFFEGRSVEEISRSTSVAEATVRKRVSRALEQLRRDLDLEHGGDRARWRAALLPIALRTRRSAWVLPTMAGALVALAALVIVAAQPPRGPAPDPARLAPSVAAATTPRSAGGTQDPDEVSGRGTVVLRLVDADSRAAIPGARAYVTLASARDRFASYEDRSEGGMNEMLRADEEGRITFEVPAGAALLLDARGAEVGYGDGRLHVAALANDASSQLELVLRRGVERPFHGRLVDGGTGDPLAGVTFTVGTVTTTIPSGAKHPWQLASSWSVSEEHRTVVTDDEGRFTLPWRSWSSDETGRAQPTDYGPVVFALTGDYPDPERPLAVRAWREATLKGTVELRDPNPGVEVGVLARPEYQGTPEAGASRLAQTYLWRTRIDDGRFTLAGLPAGLPLDLEIRFRDATLHRARMTLEPGETRAMTWTQPPLRYLSGRLLDERGEPLARKVVRLASARPDRRGAYLEGWTGASRTDATDERGVFVFDDVQPGRWYVGPATALRRDGDPLVAWGGVVELESEGPPVTIVARSGRELSGRVIDEQGRPLAGVRVRAFAGGVEGHVSAESDAEGRFRLGPIADGEHTLSFAPTVGADGTARSAESETLAAPADATPVEVTYRQDAILEVTTLDADGRPVPGQFQAFGGASARVTFGATTESAARLTLPPGPVTLVARAGEDRIAVARGLVLVSGERLVSRLVPRPGATIVLRSQDPSPVNLSVDGLPLGLLQIGRPTAVPAGHLRLERTGAEAGAIEVVVEVGDRREVALDG